MIGFETGGEAAIDAEIGSLRAGIDRALLRRFDRIATKYDRPLVPVRNGVCYGCFVHYPTAKIAELDCVRAARGAHPVLLLDDVSSELDPGRTGAVYELVKSEPSQVFVTTTRPELFVTDSGAERLDLRMVSGRLIRP